MRTLRDLCEAEKQTKKEAHELWDRWWAPRFAICNSRAEYLKEREEFLKAAGVECTGDLPGTLAVRLIFALDSALQKEKGLDNRPPTD